MGEQRLGCTVMLREHNVSVTELGAVGKDMFTHSSHPHDSLLLHRVVWPWQFWVNLASFADSSVIETVEGALARPMPIRLWCYSVHVSTSTCVDLHARACEVGLSVHLDPSHDCIPSPTFPRSWTLSLALQGKLLVF
jgi:hypothetical protein